MVDCKMIELALADIGITRLIVCKIICQSLFDVLSRLCAGKLPETQSNRQIYARRIRFIM